MKQISYGKKQCVLAEGESCCLKATSRCLEAWMLRLRLFQTPHDGERVSTLDGADESALFHRLDGIAIGRQSAYFFIIFQAPQNWVAAERISFELISVFDVRK
jgi:hypothetical protein